MELTEIIAGLETYTGEFPRLALERAIEEREAITPILDLLQIRIDTTIGSYSKQGS